MGYGSRLICHFVSLLICTAATADSVEMDTLTMDASLFKKHGNGLNVRGKTLKLNYERDEIPS